MLKKLFSVTIIVALLGVLPLLGGCGNEYKVHTQSETTSSQTHTVVE